MSAENRFGVPLGNGERAGIIQPLRAYHFRVNAPGLLTITANTEKVDFDFVTKTVKLIVRQTVQAESFDEAYLFGQRAKFTVDAMDGGDGIVFNVSPLGLKLEHHGFAFDYTAAKGYACHEYIFSFTGISSGEPLKAAPAEHDGDPRFPTPAEAVAALEEPEVLELDLQQEMRITPDNPDSDGDGVPDALDKHPNDPKKR